MDPFLLTHRVTDALFDIGPGFTPPSLRDQTIRGWLLADKAAKSGIIGPSKPLLVVGAGLAGTVTALTAASLNVPTTVIDLADKPLNVQLGCYSRVLCPAQYDWPANHWSDECLPWTIKIPLSWRQGKAGYLALALGREFLDQVESMPLLTFLPHTQVPIDERKALKDRNPQGDFPINFLDVHTGALDPNGPYRFAAVFSCLGPGVERSSLNKYSGFRFWELDPFSEPNLNLNPSDTPKVYISGGGDGALQDFLRIATNRETAKEVFLSLPVKVRETIQHKIQAKEENFKRSHSWFVRADHDIHQQIQDHQSKTIDEVLDKHETELHKVLGPMLSHLSKLTLRLAYRCDHFTNYYCLNGILTLLVTRYWERTTGTNLLLPRTETVEVRGINFHHCDNKPWDCHGKNHEVVLRTSSCHSTTPSTTVAGIFNVVILRYGPELPSESFFGLPVHTRRQLLPYYL